MIKTLIIKDFIIIDDLKLEFDNGFNVITGETGAGKSIMINAIDLAFGARSSKEVIKSGKQRAFIELSLSINDKFPDAFFDEYGIEKYDSEIILSREITETASRSRINGTLVTQDVIKRLRELVIDIHNQHMTYTYIQPKYHIELLDSYGDEEHNIALASYKTSYDSYIKTLAKLEEVKNSTKQTEQQIEFLKFQIDEIESANIQDINEDEKLSEELSVLANAEKLKDLTYSAYWALYGDDGSIINALGKVKSNVSKAFEMDHTLSNLEAEVLNAQESLREVASSLRNYAESMDFDEQRIDEIQQRMDILDKIKRKYGSTLEQVLQQYNAFCEEYNNIEFSQERINELENLKNELEDVLLERATKLSDIRKSISIKLSQIIQRELELLDMPKVKFEIQILPSEFKNNGCDNVEFLISTNISEEPKPLAKIASGGEISRVMLAIKAIFAQTDNINTIIFDEIDTGISGNACQAVSQAITKLAKSHQIISITHQPIIAAKSDRHFYVAKTQDETTSVKVYTLDEANKIKAIAMLAAGEISDESLKFARQLIYN